MLLFVELLEVRDRVLIPRVETQYLREGLDGAIDESAAAVVEPETEEHVGVFELAQVGPLQEVLVFLDRPSDLSLLAIEIAEDQMNLERVAGDLRRLLQFVDRRIDLVGDEKIQSEHVVRRFARPAPIGPHTFPQLVAFPRFPDREAQQERHQAREQDDRSHRGSRSAR